MHIQIPQSFKNLFWDYDFETINVLQYKNFVIERILEKGNWDSVNWICKTFAMAEIMQVVSSSSNLSPATKIFWNQIINNI